MAKSLAQALACEGHLASDLAMPQLIHERVFLYKLLFVYRGSEQSTGEH